MCLSFYKISRRNYTFYPGLPKHFSAEECDLIKGFTRHMHDFVFWPKHLDFKYFSTCLNNLHPAIKYKFEKAKLIQSDRSQPYQVMHFLDIEVILYSNNTVKTDIYNKDTNTHDYLPYNSRHTKHCKDNLPYHLAKRIIAFVSDHKKVEMRLKKLRNWLKDCNYPDSVINQ